MKSGEKEDRKKICRWLAEWEARDMVMKKLGEIENKVDSTEAKLNSFSKGKQPREYTIESLADEGDRIKEKLENARMGYQSLIDVIALTST